MLKFYSSSSSYAWTDFFNSYGPQGPYILAVDEDKKDFLFVYLTRTANRVEKIGWSYDSVLLNLKSKYWVELNSQFLSELFAKHKKAIPTSLEEITNGLNEAKPIEPIKPKKSMSDTIVLSAGKLFVNVHTKQVERIVSIQNGLIWTSRHKQEAKPYGRTNFRKATDAEVKNYLAETAAS